MSVKTAEKFELSDIYNAALDEFATYDTNVYPKERALLLSMLKACRYHGDGNFESNFNELHASTLNALGWVRRTSIEHKAHFLTEQYKEYSRRAVGCLADIRKNWVG